MNINEHLLEFGNIIKEETIKLMEDYKVNKSQPILREIKERLEILKPVVEIEAQHRQLEMFNEIKESDFAKNFNMQDIVNAFSSMIPQNNK